MCLHLKRSDRLVPFTYPHLARGETPDSMSMTFDEPRGRIFSIEKRGSDLSRDPIQNSRRGRPLLCLLLPSRVSGEEGWSLSVAPTPCPRLDPVSQLPDFCCIPCFLFKQLYEMSTSVTLWRL